MVVNLTVFIGIFHPAWVPTPAKQAFLPFKLPRL